MTAQLSPLRTGRITGSRVGPILGHGPYQTRDDVFRSMVRDALGASSEWLGNWMTDQGHEHEEGLRVAYERQTGQLVVDAQEFVIHPEHDLLGVSPDGLVGEDGAVEFKWRTHRAKWRSITDKPGYLDQVQALLACTGRAWCDFVHAGEGEPLIIERIPADPSWLIEALPVLTEFHAEYQRVITDPELAKPYLTDLVALMNDPESAIDEEALAQIQAERAELDAWEEAVRGRLIERAEALGAKTARGRWFQVTRVNPSKKVRYKDALAALAPDADLAEFTDAPGKPSYRISRMKEAE